MKILVTFAVDWELRPWRRLRAFRPSPDDCRVFHAHVAGSDIKVILTGVGAENALRTLGARLDQTPDLCIISGLAGGLKSEHRPGDILAARTVRREREPQFLKSDEEFFRRAVACGAKPVESFVSVSRVVRTPEHKLQLGAFADAVDMESFSIMEMMTRWGAPSVAVRSVADAVETDLVCDFDRTLDASGRVRMVRVLGQVARAPKGLWPLVRLGVASSRAASALAVYLEALIDSLGAREARFDLSAQQVVKCGDSSNA
jgi:adenosylhomocysteine nucleosidase